MNRLAGVLSLSLVLVWLLPTAQACYKEIPVRVDDQQLGYSVTFPGRCVKSRQTEQTPFGEIDWFGATYTSVSRFDQTFSVYVGTLPPGDLGGTYEDEILKTAEDWIKERFPGATFPLRAEDGPGFEYASKTASRAIRGVMVLRRGRLHHAQGSSQSADDPRLKEFLESFQVYRTSDDHAPQGGA